MQALRALQGLLGAFQDGEALVRGVRHALSPSPPVWACGSAGAWLGTGEGGACLAPCVRPGSPYSPPGPQPWR
jgi:hypothetical protein